MKKTPTAKSRRAKSDEMQEEYDFEYRKARSNRFADHIDKSSLVVVIEPDISKVFTTPESVNTALRAIIAAMPKTAKSKELRK